MKTVTTTTAINIMNSDISTIYQLLKMKNTYFDGSICKYKKTRKQFKTLIPIIKQDENGVIYKLSYVGFLHKNKYHESLTYIPVAHSRVIFKSLV